jgi:DNA polymerase III subunit epsilon
MFAIIDIETTGGRSVDRITEIAIITHDGEKIIDEFSTLINPEVPIPYFISSLTGITNDMVAYAPKFYEVAKKVVEMTADKIFVAHSASFDYHFIKNEFKSLGFDFKRKTLCTVKLSRKLIPALNSYSLGELCAELGIEIKDRHRAGGDAMATVKLFEYLLAVNGNEIDLFAGLRINSLGNLHPMLNKAKIEALPEETGVYYFYDERKELIYVGKSNNIYGRVLSHFSNFKSKKSVTMRDSIADIDHVLTGSELVALLHESHEIKKHVPLFNRSQRRTTYTYGIYSSMNENGYLCLKADKIKGEDVPHTVFHSQESARSCLTGLAEQYHLCQKLCGLYDTTGACFHYSIKLCDGACIGAEDVEAYNLRVKQALFQFEFEDKNFIIIDKGRKQNERSVVKVENGRYMGYGYIDVSVPVNNVEELSGYITRFQDNRDVQQIIRSYLKRHKVERIIKF